jgi:hypothetical protein
MVLDIYVVAEAGGWAVKRAGGFAITTHAGRDEAIVFARSLAADNGARLIVVEPDGRESIARIGIAPLELPPEAT